MMAPEVKSSAVLFDKPVPRPPKSPEKLAQLHRQDRRREYLRRNPSYLTKLDHELADPILYERLIKRFQTPQERDAEGKAKGYGRTLEADLVRGETRLANLEMPELSGLDLEPSDDVTSTWEAAAESKEHGTELWHEYLEERFVYGKDDDFDYSVVDTNDDLDVAARDDAEDTWFEEEDPSWVEDLNSEEKRERRGETGIQDF